MWTEKVMESGSVENSEPRSVVIFENVIKSYSSIYNRHPEPVLKNINLDIPSGTIFGLLGPSGCGKTTLLKCVVGRLEPDKGIVKVFGLTPGTVNSGIPGKRIGYMPQDVALTEELTVNETLNFFGRTTRMNAKHIKNRIEFLLKLLQMREYQHKTLNKLSGGQKRRVSFAVALLHEPPILILDEPTVGVDPLLRQNIWKHLYTLTSLSGVTILITTHYIEEARMAHNVGLMLNGKLLIQSPPETMIQQLGCTTLEEAFVQLCLSEEQNCKSEEECVDSLVSKNALLNVSTCSIDTGRNQVQHQKSTFSEKRIGTWNIFSFQRLLALTIKTFIFTLRNPASVLLQLVVAPLTLAVFALSIGKAPFGIRVAVVNHDTSDLGQFYVDSISKHSINLVHYTSYDEAIRALNEGLVYGAIYLNPNFTESVINRFSQSVLADELSISESKVQVALDFSNKQVALTVNHQILETFHKYTNKLLSRMGINPELADIPIQYHGDVNNLLGVEIDQFLIPGFMVSTIFFMVLGTAAINHLNDRQLGCVDRLKVTGITDFELIISQLISQTIVLLLLVPLDFVVVFLVLGFQIQGSLILALTLNIIQGVCGVTMGIFIASFTDQLTTAIVVVLAMFFVSMMMQGIMWPLESLPIAFRAVSHCLPSTYSVLAMRNIVNHSADVSNVMVIMGLSSSCIWITVFIILSWLTMRIRS